MIRIGNLQVDFARREVRHRECLIRVSSRAFDILEVLAKANGELVSKDEIMRVVWPSTVVEENNLQVHVSALRKVLGADSQLIRTVPGRGYRLLHAFDHVDAPLSSDENPRGWESCRAGELVGRDLPLNDVMAWLRRSSTMTLVGAGGIGKTRLALEAARTALPEFADGVAVVSFAPVTDERFTLDALAAALHTKLSGGALSMNGIVKSVRGKRMLIVLDNCEHVIEAAANIALALRNAGQVVLATSREPLRIPDETVYAVPSLDVPASGASSDELKAAGAVRLFLARVRAVEPDFHADDTRLLQIAAVCRSLDGIPLAIELAAARAAILGVEALTHHLEDRLRMLTGGYRTALPRHQTMRATLDWSYRLLTELERLILRRTSVCAGGFTLDTVCFIAATEGLSAQDASDALSGLILKSMVSASGDGSRRRYRLLETTRQYALQQLDDNGERRAAATAHARHLLTLLNEARTHSIERTDDSRMAVFSSELDNVRAALDWCLSPAGEPSVGVALASAAVPFFFELSLVSECAGRASQALATYRDAQHCDVSASALLRLHAAWASGLVYTSGPIPATRTAWTKVYSDAVLAGNDEYEARALWGLWNAHQYGGEPRDALVMARRFSELAARAGDETQRLLGMRIEAIALHYLGDQNKAREQLDAMLELYDPTVHRWNAIGFRIEHRIVARATLARVLWVQGHVQQALDLANAALAAAIDYDNEMVTCYVLVEAVIPLALLSDDLQGARDGIDALKERASRMSFCIWVDCCACYEQCIAAMDSPDSLQLHALEAAIARLRQTGFLAPLTFFLWMFGQALLKQGEHDTALNVIEQGLEHCHLTGERWLYAELACIKGTLLATLGVGMRAGEWLAVALTTARRQGAHSLEKRANLAFSDWLNKRLDQGHDELAARRARKEEASSVLSPLLASLSERANGNLILFERNPLAKPESHSTIFRTPI